MKLRVTDVQVGERRRQDQGDIDGLAASLSRFGLLHPIVVDADGRLVAGGRRLAAAIALGWDDIEARSLGELSDAELREIELEENLRRKDLTEYEQKRVLMELAETAARVLADSAKTQRTGRPPKNGVPQAQVAERIGVPRKTLSDAKEFVETANAYPFMQTWKEYQALEAREVLEQLPEPERPKMAALVNQPGIPPKDAIRTVRNVVTKPVEERERIYTLATSEDSRDRTLALTEAAAMPPMPDPRLTLFDDAHYALNRALRMFRSDPANDAIKRALSAVKEAYLVVRDTRRE